MLIPLLMLFSVQLNAACNAAGSGTLTTTSTANTCGGNGTITATFDTTTNTSVQLLLSGTVLQQIASPSSTTITFSNLQPGDYVIRTICSEDNSIIYQSSSITVADDYVAISGASISVSDLCSSFETGAVFTVDGVTGGNAPYTYAIYYGTNAAFDDATATYQSSNVFDMTGQPFGTYQIRVKDACGNFSTFTKTIAATVDPIEFYWSSKDICNSDDVIARRWYTINPNTGSASNLTDYFPTPGIKLKIQDTNSSGAVIYEGDYFGGTFQYTPNSSGNYYITTTNACGVTSSYYRTYNPTFDFGYSASTEGCGASETETITILMNDYRFWSYPVSYIIYKKGDTTKTEVASGSIDEWQSDIISGLGVDDYTIEVTDSCGEHTITKDVANPTASTSAPVVGQVWNSVWRCDGMEVTQTGTTQVVIRIDGYVPDVANATVVITSGPSNVGVAAQKVDVTNWGWTNMLPGTYTIDVTSPCGDTYTIPFTVGNSSLLQQSITSTATSTCIGTGTINSTVVYTGNYDYRIELLDSTGAVVAYNSTGTFTNVAAGTYTTRLRVNPCANGNFYYIIGDEVTITSAATGPKIKSFVGVVCEDADGNPLGTGNAYVSIDGVAPLTFQYKESGTSTWTTISNADANLVISGLTANTLYDYYVLDACGKSLNGSGSIKTIGSLTTTNAIHPCVGESYDLEIPFYSGATYSWSNSAGSVVSNTRIYSVVNWDGSYDGTYTAKITWGGCVTRYVVLTVDSDKCGEPIVDICYYDPSIASGVDTNHGISLQKRAGGHKTGDVSSSSDWPMLRKSAYTVLESNTKGFVITRMADPENTIGTNAVEGMMVYDTDDECLKIYDGTTWSCFTTQTCP